MGSLQKLLVMFDWVQFSLYFTDKIKSNFAGFLRFGLPFVQSDSTQCRLKFHVKFM